MFTNVADLLSYLEEFTPSIIINPRLETIQLAAQCLQLLDWGNTTIVTVAGSNGKGSTCTFLQKIAEYHSLSTGLYTSPHLLHYSERIQVNGKNIYAEPLLVSANKVFQYQAKTKEKLTYFELTTLIAFDIFQKQQLDLVILEVGLGGKYDAVNIAPNHGSIITSISYEHEQWLGSTLDEIGTQKAGIIKPYSKVVLGQNLPQACIQISQEAQSNYFEFAKQFNCIDAKESGYWFLTLNTEEGRGYSKQPFKSLPTKIKLPDPSLIGHWQKHNASLAIRMFMLLDYSIDISKLASALTNTQLIGRLNTFSFKNLNGWLEVGHNPGAAQVIANYLEKKHKQIYGIYASLSDKDSSEIIKILNPFVKQWLFIELDSARAKSVQKLKQEMQKKLGDAYSNINLSNVDNCAKTEFSSTEIRLKLALEQLNNNANSLPVLIFGSFELIEAALKIVDIKVVNSLGK